MSASLRLGVCCIARRIQSCARVALSPCLFPLCLSSSVLSQLSVISLVRTVTSGNVGCVGVFLLPLTVTSKLDIRCGFCCGFSASLLVWRQRRSHLCILGCDLTLMIRSRFSNFRSISRAQKGVEVAERYR